MCRLIGLPPWCARCEGRHDHCGATITDPDRNTAGGLPLWPSGSGIDGANRVEARSAFRGHRDLPVEARRSPKNPGMGWHRNGVDIQNPGTGQLCMAEGSGWNDAAVEGPVRGLVRRARLAAGDGATGSAADCGRMTHRLDFGIVLLGFSASICYEDACRSPLISATSRTFLARY